jgi:hypothetical protein
VQPLWKSIWMFLKTGTTIERDYYIIMLYYTWACSHRNVSQYTTEKAVHLCLLQYYSVAKLQNHPRCPSINEWIKKCEIDMCVNNTDVYIHTYTYMYICLKEE